jgi:phytoene synthase
MDVTSLRPFGGRPWSPAKREAAASLWDWHDALGRTVGVAAGSSHGDEYDGEREYLLVLASKPIAMLPAELSESAYAACQHHHLSLEDLARQARAADGFRPGHRFTTVADLEAFAGEWAIPLGRQLSALAGIRSAWQLAHVDAFCRAIFHLRHLVGLPLDLGRDRLFLPLDELERFSVEEAMIAAGKPTEGVRRVLWKHSVRIRDAFAQARPLARDLPRRYSRHFRSWWTTGLELINEIERRDFDVWSKPVSLSLYHRAQSAFQARFSRVSFRRS